MTEREKAVALVEQVGLCEAARRLKMSKATLHRWSKKAKQGEPEKAAGESEVPAKAPHTSQPSRARAERLEQLGAEVRADLRKGVRELSGFIASGGVTAELNAEGEAVKVRDMRAVAHAANALKLIFDFAPGIASFDEQTAGRGEDEGASDADAARLDAAMLTPVVEPRRGPRLVETG